MTAAAPRGAEAPLAISPDIADSGAVEALEVTRADPRVDIQSALLSAPNYNGWIAGQARAVVGQRVLDAGCGAGNIMASLVDRELVVGVDEWPEFVAATRNRFRSAPNVQVEQGDLSDPGLADLLGPLRLDSAMCVNVLEHVEDHRAVLRNFAAVLPAGAPVFVLVPAFPSIYGAHDRADHHVRRYTRRSLAEAVAGLPLVLERSRYMNLPGYFAWFALGRVLKRQVDAGHAGLYDRLIPAIRAIEQRVRPPFGQTLVAVLRTEAQG